jgi:branched-chain amino acid transport system ATP-binding protein
MIPLVVSGVSLSFGGLTALADVSLALVPGERRALLGPNGAGKTTLFNVISGALRPDRGRVALFGEDATALAPYRRARRGLARTFQITSLFPLLTVEDNVLLALSGLDRRRYRMHRPIRSYRDIRERATSLIETWDMTALAGQRVRALSYGDQRRLEIVMALAGEPQLLLLDEPTAGLSLSETRAVTALIGGLPRDTTILFVEHDMDVAFELADRVTVLSGGVVVADGLPAEIRGSAKLREIYFGGERI